MGGPERKLLTSRCVETLCTCMGGEKITKAQCECSEYESLAMRCEEAAIREGKEKGEELLFADWREKTTCQSDCPAGKVAKYCHRGGCERTCSNFREPCEEGGGSMSTFCISGCFCPAGKVIDEESGRCVETSRCRDCVCRGNVASYYHTFDGRAYKMDGNCSYIAAKHIDSLSDFEVTFTNGECRNGKTDRFCTVEVRIKSAGNTAVLTTSREDPNQVGKNRT